MHQVYLGQMQIAVVSEVCNVSKETPPTHFDHYRLAKSYEKMGRLEDALSAYTKAIELRQDYAHAWFYKAQLHQKMKQYSEAIRCAQRALELEPNWTDHITRIIADCKSKSGSAP